MKCEQKFTKRKVLQAEGIACAKALSQVPRYWRIRRKIRMAGMGGARQGRAHR